MATRAGLTGLWLPALGSEIAGLLPLADGERLEPPVFVKELQDMEVTDGDKVELVVEVKGQLNMQISPHHIPICCGPAVNLIIPK